MPIFNFSILIACGNAVPFLIFFKVRKDKQNYITETFIFLSRLANYALIYEDWLEFRLLLCRVALEKYKIYTSSS